MNGETSLSQVLPGSFSQSQTPAGSAPPSRRGAARAQKRRRKQRRRRSVVVLLLVAALVAGAAVAGYRLVLRPVLTSLNQSDDYPGPGTGSVQVKVPAGASGRDIAEVLVAAGVVKSESAYVDASRDDPRATGIQPGTYTLRSQMSASGALGALLDPISRQTKSVTVPEGTRAKRVYQLIADKLGFERDDVADAATSGDIGLPKAAKGEPEGFLFPDTYEFEPDVTATEVLRAMVERGQEVYADLGIAPAQLRDIVIKASIVQAEAGDKKYMGKVARVLDNRLAIDQKLQLDSTVSYGTQRFGVTTTAEDRATDSPYNTYRNYGLPGGPIDNPGRDALEAALKPTPGGWLYFVTTNPSTGETKFAETGAEHIEQREEFRQWLRDHPSAG